MIKILSVMNHGISPTIALNVFKATIKAKLDYSSFVTITTSNINKNKTQTAQTLP